MYNSLRSNVLACLTAGSTAGKRASIKGSLKPWPNGVASKRKLGNVNLRTQACDGWPNGLASRRNFKASGKKAISVQPFACARTKENNTETNLRRLALGGQTVKNLRSLACKFELDQSERKLPQVIASHSKYTQVMAKRSRKLMQVFNLR